MNESQQTTRYPFDRYTQISITGSLSGSKIPSFQVLLERKKSVTIHLKKIQIFLAEFFEERIVQSPEIMSNVFQFNKCEYNVRSNLQSI